MRSELKKDLHKLKKMGVWLVILTVFITQLLFYTWCRVQCVNIGYDITRQTDRHRELMILHNNLKIELARLKSPERIALIARNRFGLVAPGPNQMVRIK